jgi:hypothetical protein
MLGGLRLVGGSISRAASSRSELHHVAARRAGGSPGARRAHRLALAPAPDTVTALGDSVSWPHWSPMRAARP